MIVNYIHNGKRVCAAICFRQEVECSATLVGISACDDEGLQKITGE